jgi:hypothetical protein
MTHNLTYAAEAAKLLIPKGVGKGHSRCGVLAPKALGSLNNRFPIFFLFSGMSVSVLYTCSRYFTYDWNKLMFFRRYQSTIPGLYE